MKKLTQRLVGDTLKLTWVNSGVSPTSAVFSIYNGSETMVHSASMTSSGNGHYYGLYQIPNTPGFYVAETIVTITGFDYKDRLKFRAITGEVD